MRSSLTRIVLFVAALAAVAPATADAQEPAAPSGGATAPASAPPSPFALSGGGNALLGRKVRFRGAVEQRLAGRTVVVQYLDPATHGVDAAGAHDRQARRHASSPAGARAAPASSSSAPSSAARRRAPPSPPSCR